MNMPIFVNLTSHPVSFLAQGSVHTIKPSGQMCRVDTDNGPSQANHQFIDVQVSTLSTVYGLPDSEPNTYYIVSGIVLDALKKTGMVRADVIAPATGPNDGAIKNEKGYVDYVIKFNGLI